MNPSGWGRVTPSIELLSITIPKIENAVLFFLTTGKIRRQPLELAIQRRHLDETDPVKRLSRPGQAAEMKPKFPADRARASPAADRSVGLASRSELPGWR